jgi:lipopolysaccharide/colanic/teichoic acid biosynthesis glycosyltransferase
MYASFVKRILDFAVAAALLAALSWLFLILAVLIAVRLGTPVIFQQERPGRRDAGTCKERIFMLYKFRTMTDARYSAEDERAGRGAIGELLPDGARLTSFGQRLRSLSLDELPELVNILKGDMSFVGPRPLLVKYLPRYSAEQARRHNVRPGLTGLAQVNGRNALTWEEKFAFDVRYTDNVSFALDCQIIAATFRIVLKREGISAEGEATMPEFLGNGDGVDAPVSGSGDSGSEGGDGSITIPENLRKSGS